MQNRPDFSLEIVIAFFSCIAFYELCRRGYNYLLPRYHYWIDKDHYPPPNEELPKSQREENTE